MGEELHSPLEIRSPSRGSYTKLYKDLTAEVKAEYDLLNKNIRYAVSREEIAFASKYSGILTCATKDATKLKAWRAFLGNRGEDASEIVARISLYNLTGEPPRFFLGASMNILDFDERICDQLRITAENWMLLMACGQLGELANVESEGESSRTLAPAAALKAYMDLYKSQKGFRSWNLDRMVDVGAEIYKVVDVFRSKHELHEISNTRETSPIQVSSRYETRANRAKRARVIEESDEDDNTHNVSAQELNHISKIQRQIEEIDKLEAENSDLKKNVVDPKKIDALNEEIIKLQAKNDQLMKAHEARGFNEFSEDRRGLKVSSGQSSPLEIDGNHPKLTTLSGQASILEARLGVAKERVTTESRLVQEAKFRYEKAQAEYDKLTKKRDEAARILNFINEL